MIIKDNKKEFKINYTRLCDYFKMASKGNEAEREEFKTYLDSTFKDGVKVIEQGGIVQVMKRYNDDYYPKEVEIVSFSDRKSYQELFQKLEKLHNVSILSK